MEHLLGAGLRLHARNFRCATGEIDLVMQDGDTFVFVEVRSRRDADAERALSSIDVAKRRRLAQAAAHWLWERGADAPCRFDVVVSLGPDRLHWIKDAFAP